MDYLTNYYKNICEQRQEEIRLLEQQLNEAIDLSRIGTGLMNHFTGSNFSRGVARAKRSLASGASALASKLSTMGSNLSQSAERSDAEAYEDDYGLKARDTHFDTIRMRLQHEGHLADAIDASKRISIFERSKVTQKAFEADFNPKPIRKKNPSRQEYEAHYDAESAKWNATLNKTHEKLGREFDSKLAPHVVLGEIASRIALLSAEDVEARINSADLPKVTYDPYLRAKGVEAMHGGHSGIFESAGLPIHPKVSEYNSWWSENGQSSGAPHPTEIFGLQTRHVREDMADLLPKELKKHNSRGLANFNTAVGMADELMSRSRAAQDIKDFGNSISGGMPAGLRMESKKAFLNNKIKNLMESASSYGSRLPQSYGAGNYGAGQRMEGPSHLPFEILHVSAPMAYTHPHMFDLEGHDDSLIAIYGRHVREDGTRGPEVVIHPHAFHGFDRDTILDHAHEIVMEKGKVSEDNILHKTWIDQGGDNPSTLLVDPTKVETQKEYNDRIKDLGF